MNRFLLIVLLLVSPALLYAQPAEQETPQETFAQQDPRLKVGLGFLVQQELSYFGRTSEGRQLTFLFPAARIRLSSIWDKRIKLFLQADFVRSPSILDAEITVPITERIEVVAGLYKSPFSHEFLLFPEDLPFTKRSMAVQALAPNRQVGASLRVYFLDERLTFEAGVFNGNGATLEANDNNRFLATGRLSWKTMFHAGGAQLGVNGAYSEDTSLNIPLIGISNGERILVGADGELILESWLVRAEFIAASFGVGSMVDTAFGYVGTLGYKLLGMHQFYASYDVLDRGFGTLEYAVLGYKVYLGEAVHILVNYRLPLDDPEGGEAALRLQFAMR